MRLKLSAVSIVATLLFSCVHKSSGVTYSQSISHLPKEGRVTTHLYCRGEGITDEIAINTENNIQMDECYKKTCTNNGCKETGNIQLAQEYDRQMTDGQNKQRLTREKFEKECAKGKGDFEACLQLAPAIPQDQKTVIRDNLCKRSDFECTPKKDEVVGTSRKYNPYEFINVKADASSGMTVVEYIEVKKKNK